MPTTEEVVAMKEQIFGNSTPSSTQTQAVSEIPSENQAVALPSTNDTVASTNTEELSSVVSSEIVTDTPQEEVIDANLYLKEKLGFDDWEAAKLAIEDYNKLKTTPQTKSELEFANEQSKKIYSYLKEGKTKEVKDYLQAQELLSNVDTMSAEQKLKLSIKMQNPLYDDELIDDEFNEHYKVDEDKFKDEEGNVDQMKLRKEKLKVQQRIANDSQKADEYFTQYRSKIDLPDITPKQDVVVDESYQKWQEVMTKAEAENVQLKDLVTKIPETALNYQFQFNDEASKLNVTVNYQFTKDQIAKAKAAAIDYVSFLQSNYYKEDGSPLVNDLVMDIAIKQNREALMTQAVTQAVNADRKRLIANQKNIPDGVQRQYSTVQPSEVETLRKQIF